MKTINRIQAKDMIDNTKGKIFGVTFTKKDGSVRTMSARTNVTKHLKGGVSTIKANPKLVGVYDMNNGYRCFDIDKLQRVVVDGEDYEVVDNAS